MENGIAQFHIHVNFCAPAVIAFMVYALLPFTIQHRSVNLARCCQATIELGPFSKNHANISAFEQCS